MLQGEGERLKNKILADTLCVLSVSGSVVGMGVCVWCCRLKEVRRWRDMSGPIHTGISQFAAIFKMTNRSPLAL